VLSGRGLCDKLITHPEESYRLWCVVVCDLETSRTRRPWPALGRSVAKKKLYEVQHVSGDTPHLHVFTYQTTHHILMQPQSKVWRSWIRAS